MKRKIFILILLAMTMTVLFLSGFARARKTVRLQEYQTIRLECPASQLEEVGTGYIRKNGKYYLWKDYICEWGPD